MAATNPEEPSETPAAPTDQKLLTFKSGGWVLLLASILTLGAAALVLYPVYTTGFHRSIGDGRNPDTYGFNLSTLTIPREQLIASGYAKDEIRAVPEKLCETVTPEEVELGERNERIRMLVASDLVIGIEVNGVARAYPVRILNVHEVVNDRVGDVPVAVTWSPLCGSAVVIDRRLDGTSDAVELGVSGLLYQSNLIMFDRRAAAKDESLWPQLGLSAIAGPAAGKRVTLVPADVVTWGDWRAAHPKTRVFLGLRTLKKKYGGAQDPVNMYLRDDDLKFPVSPYWKNARIPKKTRSEVTSSDGVQFKASLPRSPSAAIAEPPAPVRISTFVFAWYAQHPNDTDYSALGVAPGQ